MTSRDVGHRSGGLVALAILLLLPAIETDAREVGSNNNRYPLQQDARPGRLDARGHDHARRRDLSSRGERDGDYERGYRDGYRQRQYNAPRGIDRDARHGQHDGRRSNQPNYESRSYRDRNNDWRPRSSDGYRGSDGYRDDDRYRPRGRYERYGGYYTNPPTRVPGYNNGTPYGQGLYNDRQVPRPAPSTPPALRRYPQR